jgi:hypothetical protein
LINIIIFIESDIIETFEKCSILFKFKPPARGAYAPEGKAKILTTPYDLPDLRGRHEYIEYFEDYNLSLTPEK